MEIIVVAIVSLTVGTVLGLALRVLVPKITLREHQEVAGFILQAIKTLKEKAEKERYSSSFNSVFALLCDKYLDQSVDIYNHMYHVLHDHPVEWAKLTGKIMYNLGYLSGIQHVKGGQDEEDAENLKEAPI